MNPNHTFARALATVTFLALAATTSFARNPAPVIPDVGAAEVAQALDRLTTENDQRIQAAIDASVAALRAEASETMAAVAPAKTQPTASVEVLLPRGNRAQRRTMVRG